TDELPDALGDPLHLVDEALVLREPPQRPFTALEPSADGLDVLEGVLQALARPVDPLDDLPYLSRLFSWRCALRQERAHLVRGDPHVLEDPLDLGPAPLR